MSERHDTYCTATRDDLEPHPWFGPRPCGSVACGPHPDPDLGYRKPLCRLHLAVIGADLLTLFGAPCSYRSALVPSGGVR